MRDSYEDLKGNLQRRHLGPSGTLGNPEAELAFNAGAHPLLSLCTGGKLCPHQTFTSGENHGFYQKTKRVRKPSPPRTSPPRKGWFGTCSCP